MEYLNDRYEHLAVILRQEMASEHTREAELLQAQNKRETKTIELKIWKERLSSVDRLTETLAAYKLTSGIDEADFLIYCLDQWKEILRTMISTGDNKQKPKAKPKGSSSNGMLASQVSPYYESTLMLEKAEKKKSNRLKRLGIHTHQSNGKNDDSSIASSSIVSTIVQGEESVADDDDGDTPRGFNQSQSSELQLSINQAILEKDEILAAEYRKKQQLEKIRAGRVKIKNYVIVHKKHPREIDNENMAKAKGQFKAADLGFHIRKGNENDLAYLAPTLIPVPRAFEGDITNQLSSYTGENIIQEIRQKMVLADIGEFLTA